METTTLRNGMTVLAGKDRYGYFGAKTYQNHTQAHKKVTQLAAEGVTAWVYQPNFGPARYIVIY